MTLTFGLHERDLLYLALQNEEAVVVQVDALRLEHRSHLAPVGARSVQEVVAGAGAGHGSLHREGGARHRVVLPVRPVHHVRKGHLMNLNN
jgi:hypothetical protein